MKSLLLPASLVLIIIAGLLWHILACVDSPMAFSPDGRNLVFTLADPYEGAGSDNVPPLFRLVVLTDAPTPDAKNLRILEEQRGVFLTGPGFSPDGTQFAYLRIPLPPPSPTTAPASQPAAAPTTAPAVQLTLPGEPTPLELTSPDKIQTGNPAPDAPPGQALLVIRDARTFRVITTARVNFVFDSSGDKIHPYLTLRPQYAADPNWIFFTDSDGVQAVNPTDAKAWQLVRTAAAPLRSPDGKTLAFLGAKECNSIAFLTTDRSSLTEWFVAGDGISPSGLAWIDNDTLALIPFSKSDNNKMVLLGRDAKVRSSVTIPSLETNQDKGDHLGELALSPDAQHIVICMNTFVDFCDGKGNLLRHVGPAEKKVLAQPTFTPDGTRVAFKELTTTSINGTDITRLTALVFYNPQGDEVVRVPIAFSTPAATAATQR